MHRVQGDGFSPFGARPHSIAAILVHEAEIVMRLGRFGILLEDESILLLGALAIAPRSQNLAEQEPALLAGELVGARGDGLFPAAGNP